MLPKFSQIVNRLYAFIYETNHSKSGLGLPSIVALVMVIDKSWTSLGKHEKAFYTGLKKFVDDCKPLVDSAGNIRCPCKSCRLVLWVSIKHLSDHISKYGFDPSYKTWIHHGEPDLPPPPPVIDNTRQPQMSDMTACLNDLSYIPLNNEQNEPTQGDIGETSNDPTQAKRNEFEELYASANEELYPGCDHVTRLDFMAKFTYFKVKVSRWKDSNTPGKKVPKKVLRYFPIIPRLQRLYKSSHTAKEMTWHATGKCTEPGKMQHLVDGRAWKDFDTKYLDFAAEPRNVDAPPDIIDVVDEDDDIIDEEDPIPHDLADSDDEDLVNLDIDDGVNVMSADVARGHGGDGGGDDRPPPYQVRAPKALFRRAGRLHTRQETQNLGLKAITDKSGPVPIRFEVNDRETLMPLGDHAAHWANYLGELVRELPLHYPSWRQMSPERKAGVVAKIGTQFDLRPHMESDRWPQIYAGIQQHLQKIYNGKKAALKERYWVPEEDGTYDLERLRRGRPSYISEVNWDAQLAFWNDPKNLARAAQNKQNRAKSKVMETSATREYPSLIHTFFLTHTVGGVFLNPEDKALYFKSEDIKRFQYGFAEVGSDGGGVVDGAINCAGEVPSLSLPFVIPKL
ncbi:hypothetical protein Tco_0210535 [Tanacetum coccineum]